ncbi:MAG: metallopeptidase [Candidatus Blackburnbacteria bacterium]|nr:metallopeptidase [Candidatus Blackburnbacteria bacterium]
MRKRRTKLEWKESPDIQRRIKELLVLRDFAHICADRVFCYESTGANTRACARIWGFNRLWQQTLNLPPAYILEVVLERFGKLSIIQQDHVLIHELLHIPKNFSGALVSHRKKGGVNEKMVREVYEALYFSRR